MTSEADYIVVGGGIAGCALASRLAESGASTKVILLEAGPDVSGDPRTRGLFECFELAGSELDWGYRTVPQKQLGNREIQNVAGKCLGGGSILNYGGWLRADSHDYDDWANTVGDSSWGYQGFLPYFKKSESFFDTNANPEHHGFNGPMHVTTISANEKRKYGLRESIKTAYMELGVPYNADPGASLTGICEHRENFKQGARQPANLAYGLKGVEVVTNALVQRVLFTEGPTPAARAVQLDDGREFVAHREVVLSAGTWRSPQILMLSGIGETEVLSRYQIPIVRHAPAVGQGMLDHFAAFSFYKIRDPSGPHSMGNPHWTDPAYFTGLPTDWSVNDTVPESLLVPAVDEDNKQTSDAQARELNNSLLTPGRPLVEEMTLYAPIMPGVPVDGSLIATSTMLLAPTSRGSITIGSASIRDHPIADPNHYSTAVDRVTLTYGLKRTLQALLGTKAGSEFIECEVPPPGMTPLTPDSSDEEIDARIRAAGINHQHAMGGNPMGKVVDTKLRVIGVDKVRVVDASVFPVGIGGHTQATLYALAEKAADIILGKA